MKFALPVIVFSISLLTISFSNKKLKKETLKDQNGFAVVELFTSEGCSSCPPADAILEEIQKKYSDKNVLVLSYHVDYWDKLGWKDIFSHADFTKRQEYYADIFNLNSIYTPQAVINGGIQVLGSDKNKLINSIDEELSEKPTTNIKLQAIQDTSGKINIRYSTDGNNSKDVKLILLLVQKMATNKISRGENKDRTLHHVNIVREIYYLPTKQGTTSLRLPTGLKKEDLFVAGLIQINRFGNVKAINTSTIE